MGYTIALELYPIALALARNPLPAFFSSPSSDSSPLLGRYAADAYSVGLGYDIALLLVTRAIHRSHSPIPQPSTGRFSSP